jgi:uncharacterized protein
LENCVDFLEMERMAMFDDRAVSTSPIFYDRKGVEGGFPAGSWERAAFADFSERIDSRSEAFPCHFGTAGFRQDQLRYHFSDNGDALKIAMALEEYIQVCRGFGQNTSFVVTIRTDSADCIEAYHRKFWGLLESIRRYDSFAWPDEIPFEVDNSAWEFCFAGEPLFVVCTTPAHQQRRSRYSAHFSLLFQPRWVFANILDTPEKANKAFQSVRSLLSRYDDIGVSPVLGMYGNPTNREHLQYFLSDDHTPLGCPVASVGKQHPPRSL